MASIGTVLQRVDELRPNAISRDDKTRWIAELEVKAALETGAETDGAELVPPMDDAVELAIPFPYDECYTLYVMAMVEFVAKDFNAYNNSMVMFNSAYSDYKRWYIRENMPRSAGGYRNVMGW